MANYYAQSRTNYFTVTDEGKYQKLFKTLYATDGSEVYDFSRTDKDGKILHCFGAESDIDCYPNGNPNDVEDSDPDWDYFANELQEILPANEVFAYTSVGHQKLADVSGYAIVITFNKYDTINLDSWIEKTAKELTKDPNFNVKYY